LWRIRAGLTLFFVQNVQYFGMVSFESLRA
jgi:hypothetical protein